MLKERKWAMKFKVEVTMDFTFERISEIEDTLIRKYPINSKLLKVGDTFMCNKEIVDYLMGNNAKNMTVVKVLQVIPEKKKKK